MPCTTRRSATAVRDRKAAAGQGKTSATSFPILAEQCTTHAGNRRGRLIHRPHGDTALPVLSGHFSTDTPDVRWTVQRGDQWIYSRSNRSRPVLCVSGSLGALGHSVEKA